MDKKKNALFWTFFFTCQCAAATPHLNADIHSLALKTIDNIYNEKYKEAEETALKIIKEYPDHPAGYFFAAAAVESYLAVHLSNRREDEFYDYCDLAIEKAEKILDKNQRDEWARFFKGGAEGSKGTYEFRYQHWITAGRHGWKGVSILRELREQKSTIADLEYGIGCYEYWRSALGERLWWMPKVKDRRSDGIEKLLRLRKTGIYTRLSASVSLIDIFLNEKRYEEALAVAVEAGRRYPPCTMFILGRAKALFGLGRFEESEKKFRTVLESVGAVPADGSAMAAVCHFWIANINYKKGRYAECIAECNFILRQNAGDDTRELVEKYYSQAEDLKDEAVDAIKKKLRDNKMAGDRR